jgi:hypothetical protein
MYMTRKSYISTELLLIWFTELFLKPKASGKAILFLNDHISHCKIIVAFCNFANTPNNQLAVKTNTILEHLMFGKVSSNKKRNLNCGFFRFTLCWFCEIWHQKIQYGDRVLVTLLLLVWTDAQAILADTILDWPMCRHRNSSFCQSADRKQKAYLEMCWIQFFLPICWWETKGIPRDVLDSTRSLPVVVRPTSGTGVGSD